MDVKCWSQGAKDGRGVCVRLLCPPCHIRSVANLPWRSAASEGAANLGVRAVILQRGAAWCLVDRHVTNLVLLHRWLGPWPGLHLRRASFFVARDGGGRTIRGADPQASSYFCAFGDQFRGRC